MISYIQSITHFNINSINKVKSFIDEIKAFNLNFLLKCAFCNCKLHDIFMHLAWDSNSENANSTQNGGNKDIPASICCLKCKRRRNLDSIGVPQYYEYVCSRLSEVKRHLIGSIETLELCLLKNGSNSIEKLKKSKMKSYCNVMINIIKQIRVDCKQLEALIFDKNLRITIRSQKKIFVEFKSKIFERFNAITKLPKFDKYKTTQETSFNFEENVSEMETRESTNYEKQSSSESEDNEQTQNGFKCEQMNTLRSIAKTKNEKIDAVNFDTTVSLLNSDLEGSQSKCDNFKKSFISKLSATVSSEIKQIMIEIQKNNKFANSLLFLPPNKQLYDYNKTELNSCIKNQTETPSIKKAVKDLKTIFSSKIKKKIDLICKTYSNDESQIVLRIFNEVTEVKEMINLALIADSCKTAGCFDEVVSFLNSYIQHDCKDFTFVIKKAAKFIKIALDFMMKEIKSDSENTISFYRLIDKQQTEFYKGSTMTPLFETFYSKHMISNGSNSKSILYDYVEVYESNPENYMLIEVEIPEKYVRAQISEHHDLSSTTCESIHSGHQESPKSLISSTAKLEIILPPYTVLKQIDKTFNHIKFGF